MASSANGKPNAEFPTDVSECVGQNSQTRSDQAVQHKLNAIADGLADLMVWLSEVHDHAELRQDVEELKRAVGLERIESTS